MGIRSDVAIAMKEYVYENLSPEVRKILKEWGFEEQSAYKPENEACLDDAGRLFITEGVKWYSGYEDVTALYKHMSEAHDEEDWITIQRATIIQIQPMETKAVGMITLSTLVKA